MSVGLVLVTHPGIGDALLENARQILHADNLDVATINVPMDSDLDQLSLELGKLIESQDKGDGVLILSDLYGSSPCNLAYRYKDHAQLAIVSGLNLSMLIRCLYYRQLPLTELIPKAVSGATEGVICSQLS